MELCEQMYFFFFSSRRRHTRWTGDWSSDVCSSDLRSRRSRVVPGECPGLRARRGRGGEGARERLRGARSEERRVGKECRSRWSPDHLKKNDVEIGGV